MCEWCSGGDEHSVCEDCLSTNCNSSNQVDVCYACYVNCECADLEPCGFEVSDDPEECTNPDEYLDSTGLYRCTNEECNAILGQLGDGTPGDEFDQMYGI